MSHNRKPTESVGAKNTVSVPEEPLTTHLTVWLIEHQESILGLRLDGGTANALGGNDSELTREGGALIRRG